MSKYKIALFVATYLPGYLGGGPIRTIENFCKALGNEYDIYIFTSIYDLGIKEPYKDIKPRCWYNVNNAHVMYLEKKQCNCIVLCQELSKLSYDLLYLNSFFNFKFTTIPLICHKLIRSKSPVLLAPRGELFDKPLKHKKIKKQIYIFLFKILQWHKKICYQGSAIEEKEAIQSIFHYAKNIFIACDFPAPSSSISLPPQKANNALRIVFLSRIVPQKNLDYAITILSQLPSNIEVIFDIYGSDEDKEYFNRCMAQAKQLSTNIHVNFCGIVMHSEVQPTLSKYDIFLFPTKSENFGHVIHEALAAGVPVLCSDQTTWHQLEKYNAGWECPLNALDSFTEKLLFFFNLSAELRYAMQEGAQKYAYAISTSYEIIEQNMTMLNILLDND